MTDVRPTRANHSLWIVDVIKMVLKAFDEASEVSFFRYHYVSVVPVRVR